MGGGGRVGGGTAEEKRSLISERLEILFSSFKEWHFSLILF